MHLLALNLQRSSAISTAIYGNFSGPKQQEIVVAKGNMIELLRPDDTGKVISICLTPVFAVVRSLLAFRLAGANRDYVVIGSDSGKISILEFDTAANDWKLVHCEVFGKTGCRRIVPGQYIAGDPKGRALLIAGIEKQKFVYVMNRDSANRLTISSPLEAHKAECIVYSVVGVDVGFDNPIFAIIELEYTEADHDPSGMAALEAEKKLTFYELDLGLNHVVRKWSEPIASTASFLLTVPGGDDGPSGVLICGENWVSYKNQGHPEIRTPIPRRKDLPVERGVLIVSGTVHKQKDLFFFMVQSEFGDVYKVSLQCSPTDRKIVSDVIVTVFDSIQTSNSLCITKTGLLFAASEFGNHGLFQFQGIGDDETAVRASGILDEAVNETLGDDAASAASVAPTFTPSSRLNNLALVDDIRSLAPLTDSVIDDFAEEESPQIVALCGRGHRSSMRVLRHGVSVTEMAVSELPSKAQAVWTVRSSVDEASDKYIVVSFASNTLVLSIGDTVEEVTDSGFLATTSTIQVVLLADNSILQVHANGIRHIKVNKTTHDLKMGGRRLEKAAANARQVVISLAGGEIAYFELNQTGVLTEMGSLDLGKEVSSLDMGVVPAGRARSSFLAVGCYDDTVQVLSLDPSDLLQQRTTISLTARADSLCLVEMALDKGSASSTVAGGVSSSSGAIASSSTLSTMYLNIGLESGVLVRVVVDTTSGKLTDFRQRFLGSRPVKLFRVAINGAGGVLALSSRAWLMHNFQGSYFHSPVTYGSLEYAASFCSEICPEGIVAVAGSTLRIITVDNLGEQFNQTISPLRYTPRKSCRVPGTRQLVLIESDHNEYNEAERAVMAASSTSAMDTDGESSSAAVGAVAGAEAEEEEDEEGKVLPIRGPVPPVDGKWASCIRVVEPGTGVSHDVLELSNNEAAFSVCTCRFQQHSEETFVIVGTGRDFLLHQRKISAAYIHVYRLLEGRLQLLHQTEVDEIPTAMLEFQGKLLVGSGRTLRLYELGKRKLLRKCENRQFPSTIVRLHSVGDRIYVGDMAESVHFVKYRRVENTLAIFADDTFPRYVTSLCVLDYDTVAAVDKFGNVFVLRMPEGANDDVEIAAGARKLWDQGVLSGAPFKLELLAHYYLGEAGTSINKCTLVTGGPDVIVVTTICGGIFAIIPLKSKDDIVFFQHLEMFMRQEFTNFCQRDHLSYRSYFTPVKNVIDGDLCERFGTMPSAKQKEFASDIDRTTAEIMKKLEDTRNIL